MSAMSDLVSVIQSKETVLDGSTTLLNGIVSAAAPLRTDAAGLSALIDDIQTNVSSLAAAVVAGTCEAAANIKGSQPVLKPAPEEAVVTSAPKK